ncbi:hypothetical protein CMV30_04540 [Nibricoccus aquaticus]|uniref:Glycosyltransferase subfamily 4-like N-terminal domain-containing protein n=1 Tax=Nibricoccus aquaticus TaxID=2576891 RepID=A0A290QG02_9BACT|nr:glycosyltransferase [Nibricoccus aquaticus]ATC63281.1 hypothetical protein CMV30_04540 [Nibricoccus aquaticus]
MARRPTRLLVATRHNPFPENDGAGAYLFDLIEYLSTRGFVTEVAWLHADGAVKNNSPWRIPAHFQRAARLHIIGGLTLAGKIWFPAEHGHGAKARALNTIKVSLKSIGLGFLFSAREARKKQPASSSTPTPAPASGSLTKASWSALPSPAEHAFFEKRVRAFRPDAILVNYCWLAPLLAGHDALPTAILSCDVVSQRLDRTPGLDPDPATPEGEARLLAAARHILAISEDDAAIFRTFLPSRPIIITPKAAEPRPLPGPTVPDRVLFVGGINDFNREGILWFLREAWPLIREKNPRALLHICGGIGSIVNDVPPGVVIRGRVPDLTAEYAEASAVIVPLLNGSGVKIKLVEAASYGKAVVTTPIGLQGLGFFRPAVIEASSATAFADGVSRILADASTQRTLGENLLQQVIQHLSRDIAYGPVLRALSPTP